MSNTCSECGTALKELLFSRYCPNEENHGTFKGIDKSVSNIRLSGFSNNTIVPGPAPPVKTSPRFSPYKTWTVRVSVTQVQWLVTPGQPGWSHTYAIFYTPTTKIVSYTITPAHTGVVIFVSGQHVAGNSKQMEITVILETQNPLSTSFLYECTYV